MSEPAPTKTEDLPPWLPLLLRPYQNLLGSKNCWDLRMADGAPVRIERGTQGLNNTFFRVRLIKDVFACKLFVADERNRAMREWTALHALHAAGIPHALEPIAYAPDGPLPQPVVIYRWVPGTPLTETALTEKDFKDLVAALAGVHRTRSAPGYELAEAWHQPGSCAAYLGEIEAFFEQVRDWAQGGARSAADLPGWVADLREMLPLFEQVLENAAADGCQRQADAQPRVPALVRGDGSLDNVQRAETGEVVFLDWQFSGLGDAAYDLAEMRWHPRGRPWNSQNGRPPSRTIHCRRTIPVSPTGWRSITPSCRPGGWAAAPYTCWKARASWAGA